MVARQYSVVGTQYSVFKSGDWKYTYSLSVWHNLFDRDRGKLQIDPQRIGEAVGQVNHADQQIEFNDFAVVEVLFERGDVAVVDSVRRPGELFSEGQRGFFFLCK